MGFEQFMKKNQKAETKEVEFAATKTLCDENGEPLKWKFRKMSSKEFFALQDSGTRKESDIAKEMVCRCCVYPSLRNKELQDSYGVKRADDLLVEMIPDSDEMSALLIFITKLNDFGSLDKEIDEAKK